jgi:putative PIN family toxin of toxin-antitoxin system
MRLAVFDTNVIISAGIQPDRAPARLVREWVLEGQVQLVVSSQIIAEYREVARRPKFRRYGFPPLWLEFLIEESLYLPDPPQWPDSLPDPNDACFLSLAHESGAWLVTGNLKHFPESQRRKVTVITPGEYLRKLED